MGAFDDLIPAPKASGFSDLIPAKSQELSIGERLVSALPKSAQQWLSNPSIAGVSLGHGSAVHGAMMGAADPVMGAAQLATAGQASGLNQAIDAKNAEYEAARARQGRSGVDVARIAGNIASPVSVATAYVAPINAASMLGKVAQGMRAGAIGGATAPVLNADEGFAGEKALQSGVGAVMGGVLTPVAAKAGDAITRRAMTASPVQAAQQADQIMIEGINRLQREGITLAPPDVQLLRAQVLQSLQQGQKIDPAAMFRKADFEALGMQPTLGQITRDGGQFSREKNLRGVAGVGEPLLSRFDAQSQRLQDLITGQSKGAADEFTAGQNIAKSLKGVDDGLNANVGAAYDKARDHLGRAAPMDSAAFSKAANFAIDNEMLNEALPAGARNIMNDITTGKIPLNVNTAVLLDRRFSGMQRDLAAAGNKEGALAVGRLRTALNDAPIADNVGEDAKTMFDAARGLAKQRFGLHDAVPALKAASEGDVSAQDFVRRFLINGKAEEVAGMAKLMPPEAHQEARRQLGAAMERAAFGQNVAGDKAFAQESFARFLNQPGMKQKLSAFFAPEEVAQFERISRVAAYTSSFPANSTVNTSNTGAAVANLFSRIPGVPAGVGLLNSARNAATQHMAVNSAMRANPAQTRADIPPEQLKFLSRILGGGIAGTAGATVGN